MRDRFKLRSFIRNQFPDFVKEDHGKIIAFMEAFYEWLDSNSSNIRNISQLKELYDIDETLDLFIEDFKNTYLASFPINLVINPTTGKKLSPKKIIKNIKDFYKAKGTKASYSFIFRLLYNSDIEIYYPKEFILKLSDGRWQQNKKLFLKTNIPARRINLREKTICQRSSEFDNESELTARGRVISSITYTKENFYVIELDLEEVFGSFSENKAILDIETGEIYGKSYSVLSDIIIDDQGYGYRENQSINFELLAATKNSYLPRAIVKRVSGGEDESQGRVLEIEITDPGLNIDDSSCGIVTGNPIDQNGLTGGTGFSASLTFGAFFEKNEFYLNQQGLLNSTMVFQDNYKFQDYSYVIKSDVSFTKYIDTVRGILHPSGLQIIGETLVNKCLLAEGNSFLNIPQRIIKRIGNYAPYTFKTSDNLSNWFDGSCYATGTHDSLIICDGAGCITGNPISSGTNFVEAPSEDCLDQDLPSDLNKSYWITFPHPNNKIDQGVVNIYENQLDDFYGPTDSGQGQSSSGWSEWNLSNLNGGTTGQQEEWLEELLNSDENKNFAVLFLNTASEFRKIPIYAFIEDVSCSYDCRYSNNCIEPDVNPLPPDTFPDDYKEYIKNKITSDTSLSNISV